MKLLTEKQAAKMLQISTYSLGKLRKANRVTPPVPFSYIAGMIRYNAQDLIEWAKTQRVSSKRGKH